mmetsp:Transcript_20605/g.53256  ORF Transcript_20605/g.53256 Transcript_20605/m.53256 type:complete len:257 (+) Transcript_20605:155-925(+)
MPSMLSESENVRSRSGIQQGKKCRMIDHPDRPSPEWDGQQHRIPESSSGLAIKNPIERPTATANRASAAPCAFIPCAHRSPAWRWCLPPPACQSTSRWCHRWFVPYVCTARRPTIASSAPQDSTCTCPRRAQQQPPCLTDSVLPVTVILALPPSFIAGWLAIRVLICAAIFMKASSTFVAFFALVSRNGILTVFANSLAVSVSTWRLLVRSHLLPTSSLLTFSDAYRSISCSQVLTCSNVSESVTSYTTMMPCAPR